MCRESETRDTAFEEICDDAWKAKSYVWVAKLPEPVSNNLLQDPEVDLPPDSGEFTPYFTFVEHSDANGDFKLEGHKLFITFQLPIADTFKSFLDEVTPVKQESKTEYEAKKDERAALLKKKSERKGKKKGAAP